MPHFLKKLILFTFLAMAGVALLNWISGKSQKPSSCEKHAAYPEKITSEKAKEILKRRVLTPAEARALEEHVREQNVARLKAAVVTRRIPENPSIELLIETLHDKDGYVRQEAMQALPELGKAAVEPLIAALDSEFSDVRRGAIIALGKLEDPRAVEPILVASLEDRSWFDQINTATALVRIGTPAVEPLIGALSHENSRIRKKAAEALGRIGDERAYLPLSNLQYSDKQYRVRETAKYALKRLKEPQAALTPFFHTKPQKSGPTWIIGEDSSYRKKLDEKKDRYREPGKEEGEPIAGSEDRIEAFKTSPTSPAGEESGSARPWEEETGIITATPALEFGPEVEALIAIINDEKKEGYYRGQAVRDLVRTGDPRVVELLLDMLKNPNRSVRLGAVEALGMLGDERAIPPLISALKDSYSKIQKRAMEALVKMGPPAVEPVIEALKDNDRRVRLSAAKVLIEIGDKKARGATEPLLAMLEDEDSDVRRAAVDALGKIGDERAVGPLITILDDRLVGYGAMKALIAIGPAAVPPLIVTLEDEDSTVRWMSAKALGLIGDESAVVHLIAALKDTGYSVRREAATALGLIGDGSAVEPLIGVLADKNHQVREAAKKALDTLGWVARDQKGEALLLADAGDWEECVKIGPPAVGALIPALRDYSEKRGAAAAEALGKIGDGRAVEPLIKELDYCTAAVSRIPPGARERLGDRTAAFRYRAAEALGRLGSELAIDPLAAALEDPDGSARFRAAEALAALGWKPSPERRKAFYFIATENWEGCVKLGPPAVEPLILALKDKDWITRAKAARTLGAIGDLRAIKPLTALRRDGYRKVRQAAGAALDALEIRAGDGETVYEAIPVSTGKLHELNQQLKDKHADVRAGAVKELGALNDPRAVMPLVEALKDNGYFVREEAIAALGEIGSPAVEPVIAVLADKSADRNARQAAALSLGAVGDNRAVTPLLSALDEGNYELKREVIIALGDIGDERAIPALGTILNDAQAQWQLAWLAAEALAKIGSPAVDHLLPVLRNNGDNQVRQAAAISLGGTGDLRAVEPLIDALDDASGGVRANAALALGRLGDKRAVKPIIKLLADDNPSRRQSAVIALGDLGDARAVKPLLGRFQDESPEVRLAAARSLARIGEPAREPLSKILRDDSDRWYATSALATLNRNARNKGEKEFSLLFARSVSKISQKRIRVYVGRFKDISEEKIPLISPPRTSKVVSVPDIFTDVIKESIIADSRTVLIKNEKEAWDIRLDGKINAESEHSRFSGLGKFFNTITFGALKFIDDLGSIDQISVHGYDSVRIRATIDYTIGDTTVTKKYRESKKKFSGRTTWTSREIQAIVVKEVTEEIMREIFRDMRKFANKK